MTKNSRLRDYARGLSAAIGITGVGFGIGYAAALSSNHESRKTVFECADVLSERPENSSSVPDACSLFIFPMSLVVDGEVAKQLYNLPAKEQFLEDNSFGRVSAAETAAKATVFGLPAALLIGSGVVAVSISVSNRSVEAPRAPRRPKSM